MKKENYESVTNTKKNNVKIILLSISVVTLWVLGFLNVQ